MKTTSFWKLLVILGLLTFVPVTEARAHCDTMEGPVVKDAQRALKKGDVTPVLKWISPEQEAEIKALFQKTLSVRSKGADAKDVADMHFFETLVRLHRAGEGEPYTGLKPEGAEVEQGIAAADHAVEPGKIDELVRSVTDNIGTEIRGKFVRLQETRKHVDHSVEAGRAYVTAYIDFIHFVEGLHKATSSNGQPHTKGDSEQQKHHHQ